MAGSVIPPEAMTTTRSATGTLRCGTRPLDAPPFAPLRSAAWARRRSVGGRPALSRPASVRRGVRGRRNCANPADDAQEPTRSHLTDSKLNSIRCRAMATRSTAYPHLFEPGSIGGLRLRNRIVQSAMGTGMAEDGRVSARDLAIQEERAAAGVGLIVFGGTAVHPTSRFPARILIESWDEAVVESLRVPGRGGSPARRGDDRAAHPPRPRGARRPDGGECRSRRRRSPRRATRPSRAR